MGIADLSVHMLVDQDTRQDWLVEAIQSCRDVRLIMSPAIKGNMTAARLAAFTRQDTEWLSWVDPDDLVEPGAFHHMMSMVGPGVSAVTGDELLISESGRVCGKGYKFGRSLSTEDLCKTPTAAHKAIVHRDVLPVALQIVGDCKYGIDWAMLLAAGIMGTVHKVDRVIYRWRQHALQNSRNSRIDVAGIARRFELVSSMTHRCASLSKFTPE